MSFYELSPAYGRDYKSAAEVKEAWATGQDFQGDYNLGFKPVNINDIPKPCTVLLRYKRASHVINISVKAGATARTPKPVSSKQIIHYRPVCIECNQSGLWQGRKGADNWASGHEKLSGHPVRLEIRTEPVCTPKRPSIATMERWMSSGVAKATDGCTVEPDGHCEHGKPSWLIVEGVI